LARTKPYSLSWLPYVCTQFPRTTWSSALMMDKVSSF
jgi:hypothetical protein